MRPASVRLAARRLVRVEIARPSKCRSGWRVVSPQGETLHECPTKKEALTFLWAHLRRRPLVYRVLRNLPAATEGGRP